ncbi:MAG: hypothetical protein CBB71_01225 [Rhodopirellula sp. TMED11]|nr:MAG: hypothetical protein CBB71_01225 [Rhodopirellula sp. TMED11]
MAAGFAQPSGALKQFGGANNHPHDGWSQTFWRSQRPFSNTLAHAGAVCSGGALMSVPICKAAALVVSMAGRGGFRCGCLRLALPTTSPSHR